MIKCSYVLAAFGGGDIYHHAQTTFGDTAVITGGWNGVEALNTIYR